MGLWGPGAGGIWARQVADTPTPPPAVCKYLSLELQETLAQSGRSKEVLELGQVLDSGKRKRRIQYNTSETRLAEALETVCERFLHYSVHAERPGSLRYAKGQSQTMNTLKNLANKGVKVDLGIPLELWDEPSVEVTQLKQQCETMLEQFEAVLEDWYFHHQETALGAFLCEGHVLAAGERGGGNQQSQGAGGGGLVALVCSRGSGEGGRWLQGQRALAEPGAGPGSRGLASGGLVGSGREGSA
uniref:Canopy FGF signaling regulator 4 n=1 Tax=Chelonoidis abingdonii TaxID=106734 RepID=A0A8C0HDA2_CHEAB